MNIIDNGNFTKKKLSSIELHYHFKNYYSPHILQKIISFYF